MKALSVRQPWAWAIVAGWKPIENRTWATDYRGPLLIHAGRREDPDGFHFLESRGIDVKIEPISILDEDFQKDVRSRSRTKTKAAEIEHAIRHHLDVELEDDPDLQASFAEALKKIEQNPLDREK